MKLPGIQYGSVPAATGYEQVGEAGARLAEGVSRGLYALHGEIVKTQAEAATASAKVGLADLKVAIENTRYVSTQDMRDVLGQDFDSLPPELKQQLTKPVTDASGATTQQDRDDIPMGLVAGIIFDKKSKGIVGDAAGQITAPGWRAPFEDAAKADVAMEASKLRDHQLESLHQDLRQTQKATIGQYVRLGAWGDALAVVNGSRAYEPGEKAQLTEHVLAEKQKAEQAHTDARLAFEAETAAQQLEAKHKGDPQGAIAEAQQMQGGLGAKTAQRLQERQNQRTEAEAEAVRNRKGTLELAVRDSRIPNVSTLEGLPEFKSLPPPVQADLVQVAGSVAEQRLRVAQLQTDKQWDAELQRFRGLPDREKLAQADIILRGVPPAKQGEFMQVREAARVRLANSFAGDDIPALFSAAVTQLKLSKTKAAQLLDMGRRWYDGESLRHQDIPPTKADAEKWLNDRLQLGDENGDDWFGGDKVRRFEAEAAGRPFQPYGPDEQTYPPGRSTSPAAAPPSPPPAPSGGTPHDLSKPIVRNADGTYSTEQTISFEADGKFYVLPTIVAGKRYSADQAIKLWREGKNKAVGEFGSQEKADAYAVQRHNEEQVLRDADAHRDGRPRRTDPATGESRVWNGSTWAKE